MNSSAPLLEVEDVYAGYIQDLNILQGINFRIYPGELVTVVGPNGAGKSTLAKAIFGLLRLNQGSIRFKGEFIGGLKPDQIVQRGMCYVPQIANVFPSLSIEENLEMGAFIRNTPITHLKQHVYETFPVLAERRKQRAGTLSGGERQMLAMGRALMLEPTLLILDEPSAALSPILVNSVFERIKQINETAHRRFLEFESLAKLCYVENAPLSHTQIQKNLFELQYVAHAIECGHVSLQHFIDDVFA